MSFYLLFIFLKYRIGDCFELRLHRSCVSGLQIGIFKYILYTLTLHILCTFV